MKILFFPIAPLRKSRLIKGMDRPSRGIALVLVIGLVGALALVGASAVRLGRILSAAALGSLPRALAWLASDSGLHYGGSRLSQAPLPRPGAFPCDDWTFREGPEASLERASSPSYARGIGWSGRLRPEGTRFSLKIESEGSKLAVNGGFLDTGNRNGGGTPADHADPAILAHRGLAHAFDNLGTLVLPDGHPRRWRIETSNPLEPVQYSVLGEDLIQNRPPGGYRSWREIETVLAPFGYTPDDVAAVRPYATLDIGRDWPQFGPPWTSGPVHVLTQTPEARIEFLAASARVLETLWRYLARRPDSEDGEIASWETAAQTALDPRANDPAITFRRGTVILFPQEASDLAAEAVAFRQVSARPASWAGLYGHLLEKAGNVFPSPFDPATEPEAAVRYGQLRVDLAFASVCPDAHPHPLQAGRTWSGWGIPRPDAAGGRSPFPCRAEWHRICRIRLPAFPTPAYTPPRNPFESFGDRIASPGLTMAVPNRFSIASSGSAGGAAARAAALSEGRLVTCERLFFGSQEDFENRDGSAGLGLLGVSAVNDAVWTGHPSDRGRRGIDADGDRAYRMTASLPSWDLDSYPSDRPPSSSANGYSRFLGGVSLAAREAGRRDAWMYWALGEADLGIAGSPPGDTPRGFVSEGETAARRVPWQGPYAVFPPVNAGPLDPNVAQMQDGTLSFFTPHQFTGTYSSPGSQSAAHHFGAPGSPFSYGQIRFMALEAWVTRDGSLNPSYPVHLIESGAGVRLTSYEASAPIQFRVNIPTIRLEAEEAPAPDAGVQYRLAFANWPDLDWTQRTWSFPFPARIANRDCPGVHHLRAEIEWMHDDPDPGQWHTDIRLFVDGNGATTRWPFGRGLNILGSNAYLSIRLADEVRLYYGDASRPPPAGETHRQGRFVRDGAYVSPLYVFDAPVSLADASWTGLTPPDYRAYDPSAGLPPEESPPLFPPVAIDPFVVELRGYWDAAGASPASGWILLGDGTAVPDAGTLFDLASAGLPKGIRSFRYRVGFHAADVAGPLVDTPVFESIWFSFRRLGRHPAWTGWGRVD